MGLLQIWRMLVARRFIILASVAAGLFVGAVIAKLMPSVYEGKSRVVVNVLKPDPVTGQAAQPRTLETIVQAQIELIHDERVTGAVVDAFGWEKSPQLRRQYEQRKNGQDLSFREWLAQNVAQNTYAYLIPNSPILEIMYVSTSPNTARRAADAVREAFVAQTVAMKRQEAGRNAQWFQKQTEELKLRLAEAETRKSKFEQDNNIILQDDNVDSESAKLKAMASAAAVPAMPSFSVGGAVSSPSAAQLASVDAQLAAARRSLGPNHPDILALQQQRAALSAAAGREMAAARAASRPVSAPSVEGLINAQAKKVLAQRGLVGAAQRLAGDVTVLRDQVAKTAQRAADFQLQAASTDSGLDILGAAVTPTQPKTLSLPLFLLGGLAAGLALGLAIAVGLEVIFRRVRGLEDLHIEGVPVVGEMVRPRQNRSGFRPLEWIGLQRTEQMPA